MEVLLIVSYSLPYCTFYKISFPAHSTALIGQFVSDVAWGELDVLLVDTPPGTSDEHLAVLENMKKHSRVDGAILVTTPQVTTVLDTKKIPAVLNRNWQIRFPQISSFSCVLTAGSVYRRCETRDHLLQENRSKDPRRHREHEWIYLSSLFGVQTFLLDIKSL